MVRAHVGPLVNRELSKNLTLEAFLFARNLHIDYFPVY